MARRATAVRKVKQLLHDSEIDDAPVDVEAIAEELGIRVEYQPFSEDDEEISGCIMKAGGEFIIGVNATHHSNRQRFTIAHELGHYVMHRSTLDKVHLDRNYRSAQGDDSKEIEANAFAAELLMPEDLVREYTGELADTPLDAEDDHAVIQKLAEQFEVSTQAMTIRLVILGLVSRY